MFTKTPNQWREPAAPAPTAAEFRKLLVDNDIGWVCSHDSYLINLASPDPVLSARSARAFTHEMERCRALGIPALVSHPGNYIDDLDAGIQRNASRLTRCLRRVPEVQVLLETTAGAGTALGASFDQLARLRAGVGADVRERVAFCADTCHLYAAGYDLRRRYDEVWEAWDRVLGLDLLQCFHLNDSRTPLGSRRDRHALIGQGTLGAAPFRRLVRDPRFRHVPKLLETPKGDDGVTNDRSSIARLRRWAESPDDASHPSHRNPRF